ncbi:MAG: alpha/beta hydrolase [Gammaproteobacteria bacterium]|nr:MAG: alpha/beta hydrolase [Gammaproteobacteria bacterium]TLZ23200.1 MAG: alpha/beta hydrolase [Gammaproteobacteria bacterium]TLZ45831.1 MAG: alpha/beta hydrolase [Gammaproteobacteria bacterium]
MPLDPHAKRLLERLAATNPPSARSLTIGARRSALQQLLAFAGLREEVECVENRTLPAREAPLPVRVYTPTGAPREPLPALIYFHGGGLVAGSLDSHDAICRSLTNASACRLISVDYRLAPEHPFPTALADGYAALAWVAAHPRELGIDADRIVLGGDSAGATLAAVVCQMAATAGRPRLAAQLLICPIMDACAVTDSRRAFAEGHLLDQATLDHDLAHYLAPDVDRTDARVSPLRAAQLQRLPPTCIHTAEFDPLRDEGAAYAERLRLAGVKSTYRCHSGMIHLFYGMGRLIPYAATAYRLIGEDLRSLLA